MRALTSIALIVGLVLAWPTAAQQVPNDPPGTEELMQSLADHSEAVTGYLDAQTTVLQQHMDQFNQLAQQLEAAGGTDPAIQIQMQMQMSQVQQQWEATSAAMNSLNQMYQTIAAATKS